MCVLVYVCVLACRWWLIVGGVRGRAGERGAGE